VAIPKRPEGDPKGGADGAVGESFTLLSPQADQVGLCDVEPGEVVSQAAVYSRHPLGVPAGQATLCLPVALGREIQRVKTAMKSRELPESQ
jgi:hypothetical protein